LEESREYFKNESQVYFEKSTATDYLRRVITRLKSEKDRATRCLDVGTKQKIQDVIKNTMIEGYKTRIIDKEGSGVETMLRDWKVEDLRLVFDVLSLSAGALKPCIELVRTYATNQGLALVKDNKDLEEKPLDMVHETINLKEKYDDLLEKAFSENEKGIITKDKEFANAVKKAFDDVVNTNPRFHEYLSLYVDSKLKTGKTQILESEFDVLFDKVISLFRHMKDKDVFEKYYKTHLAKRLLGQRSQSDEAEKIIYFKVKNRIWISIHI